MMKIILFFYLSVLTVFVGCSSNDKNSASKDLSWLNPLDLTDSISPDGNNTEEPHVAVGANGNTIIVWSQSNGSNSQIYRSEYKNGAWEHPAGLGDNISLEGFDAYSPKVAMSSNGDALIVWKTYDGSSNEVIAMINRVDEIWSIPVIISPLGGAAQHPEVAMDSNGDAIITWQQNDNGLDQILMSELRDGAWTHPADSSDNISPDAYAAYGSRVAMSSNGDAVIVWNQYDGAESQVFKSEYRNGSWVHPVDETDNVSADGQSIDEPQVAMSANGDTIIVWSQSDGVAYQIFKSEFRNGSWTDPSGLSDNISPDLQDAYTPKVAMSSNGEAVIVWSQYDGTTEQIFISEFRGSAWIHPTSLADNISPDDYPGFSPEIAMSSSGATVIAWVQDDGNSDQIFRSEYRNGTWIHPLDLTPFVSPADFDTFDPQLAMGSDGVTVIVWAQAVPPNSQIFKSEYR